MLKLRIITALVLAPLVVWGVFSLPSFYFSLSVLIVVGLASWEWAHLSGITGTFSKIIYATAAVASLVLLVWYLEINHNDFYILLYISILWWLYRVVRVLVFRTPSSATSTAGQLSLATALSCIVALVIPFYAIIYLRDTYSFHGYLFYLVMLIWSVDVFAYFFGKYLGKNKLAPHVSPGKTWEGVYGALVATFFASVIGAFSFDFTLNEGVIFFALSFLVVVISIFGDLSESLYKRQNAVKDSGNLLPGHGGMLDRVDSLSAAAPFYVTGLSVLGFLR
ncbi:Phosphatidate cytidylyltransferase [hydrothermal vent metagenome]|uniref:Phosphatidate cytidylyltransferase n=1 Tax=hydrothermal vent metagenome TaxID=652676 RepID=A0A3B1ACL5_9ZZZZ